MKKIAITTLGCKANRYDAECIADACRRAGFEIVDFSDEANAYIINTCTVTAIADSQARQTVRRAKRKAPEAKIIAVGCSVQNNREDYQAIEEIDAVFGVRSSDEVIGYLTNVIPAPAYCLPGQAPSGIQSVCHPCESRDPETSFPGSRLGGRDDKLGAGMTNKAGDALSFARSPDSTIERSHVPVHQSRARALLKIQDGCDRRCTYCAVWKARGPSTSVALQDVRNGYRALSQYPEVMITGIHIGQYGDDLDENVTIYDLVRSLSEEEAGSRIRLSSLNPDECDDRLIDLLKNDRVCRHVHLSVQSLADPVIKAMGRAYTAGDVERIVNELHGAVPGIAIGADIIAGFPGETADDHRATMEMIEKLPFSYLHVFPYSARPGTKAAELEDQVPKNVRKERAREIIELANEKKNKFYEHQRGEIVEAVVVSRKPDACGRVRAVADNYVALIAPDGPAYGTIARARIEELNDEEVRASWC